MGSRRETSGETGNPAAGEEGSYAAETITVRENYLQLLTYLAPEILRQCVLRTGSEVSSPRDRRKRCPILCKGNRMAPPAAWGGIAVPRVGDHWLSKRPWVSGREPQEMALLGRRGLLFLVPAIEAY